MNITFMEFETSKVNKTSAGKGNSTSPKDGMPARNTSNADSGNQGQYNGQKKPPKKAQNGTVQDGEYIDGGAPQKGNATNKTRGGGGTPTKGEYNSTSGGYKTFGSEGQGQGK